MSIKFDETNLQGLTELEALERLAQDGYNELPTAKKRTIFHIVLEAVRKPMFLMLIACGVLYLLLGDRGEASILLGFIGANIGITLYQELCLQRGFGVHGRLWLSVIANLGLIFANRYTTRSILATLRIPNSALWWVTGGAIAFLGLVLEVPLLRELFKFAELQSWEIVLIAVAGLVSILMAESTKLKGLQRFITGK